MRGIIRAHRRERISPIQITIAAIKRSMNISNLTKPIFFGALASIALLGAYFAVLTLISGWGFAQSQFTQFWYYIVILALGFGIQIGLYVHLKNLITGAGGGGVLGVTGATSTAAMVSCCTHYLANLLPILGAAGLVTFASAYQIELFWAGILFNLGGIAYMSRTIIKLTYV